MVKKFRRYLYSFWRNSRTWQTDRRTPGDGNSRAMHSIARQKSQATMQTPRTMFVVKISRWCLKRFKSCQAGRQNRYTHRQTHKETHRQTHIQTDTHTYRYTNRHTYRHTCKQSMLKTIRALLCNPLYMCAFQEQEVKVIWQKAPHGGRIPRLGSPKGVEGCTIEFLG